MDIEKLIEQANRFGMELRRDGGEFEYSIGEKFLNYATALSTLQAENSQLRESRDHWKRLAHELSEGVNGKDAEHERLQAENEKLRAELEQVKRECDEAVQCIRGIAKSGRVWMCPYCVHAKDTTGGIAECELDVGVCMMPYSKFEWRGQKED